MKKCLLVLFCLLFSVFVVSCRSGNKSSSAATKALSSSITLDVQSTSGTNSNGSGDVGNPPAPGTLEGVPKPALLVFKLGQTLEVVDVKIDGGKVEKGAVVRITFKNADTNEQRTMTTRLINTNVYNESTLCQHFVSNTFIFQI